jgi:hypothetical protein
MPFTVAGGQKTPGKRAGLAGARMSSNYSLMNLYSGIRIGCPFSAIYVTPFT